MVWCQSRRYSNLSLLHQQYHIECVSACRARNGKGLLDVNYWRGTLNPRPTVDWYLDKVQKAIAQAVESSGEESNVTLLCHSAGGWLGRLYLNDYDRSKITRFVSLGSPHLPPPAGVIDQTRGILTFIDRTCPHAFHDEIQYITIAGKFLKGSTLLGKTGTFSERLVGAGYKQVCGSADVWGDGVVPLPSAHLQGAINITLDDVYHSPLGASRLSEDELASYTTSYMDSDDYDDDKIFVKPSSKHRRWYGCPSVLSTWVEYIG
jgi:pimeloyl-ACP methyl ester carboxylesterase